jgi:hypothetical protein
MEAPPRTAVTQGRIAADPPGPSTSTNHLTVQPRSTWTSALEDTIRQSISSFRSFRLPGPGGAVDDATALADLERAGIIDKEEEPLPPVFAPIPRPLTFTSLPVEVQLSIMRQMPFGDIERMRRTCKHFYHLASPEIMRLTLGATNLREMLLSHCHVCLAHDASRENLLMAETGKDYPFSAKCITCALRARDRRLSRKTIAEKTTLGSGMKVWVCRWCGLPVVGTHAPRHAQFHPKCYSRYGNVLIAFFFAGWVQLSLGLTAAAFAWKYFRNEILVFAPSVVSRYPQAQRRDPPHLANQDRRRLYSCGSSSCSSYSEATRHGLTASSSSWKRRWRGSAGLRSTSSYKCGPARAKRWPVKRSLRQLRFCSA